MLRFVRPPKPMDFDSKTEAARTQIERIIADEHDPETTHFPARWRKFKHLFRDAQHRKCAYCEHDTGVSCHGDLEHFAPKAAVHEIRAGMAAMGHETASGEAIRYPIDTVSERGYWWRAYDWDNYLFACAICNQVHKRCLFPVDPQQRPRRPAREIEEAPLLLNPYAADFAPEQHLSFSEFGQIVAYAGDTRGWETIRTCRLDRIELCEARRDKARQAYGLAEKLLDAIEREEGIDKAIADLRWLGSDEKPFAGMVRIVIQHQTGIAWNDLMTW